MKLIRYFFFYFSLLSNCNQLHIINLFQAVFSDKEKCPRKSRSKAFDTIKEEENGMQQKQQKSMLSKGVQVSRGYNHTLQKIKPLHRTSSASSSESIISIGRTTARMRPSSSGTTPKSSTEKLNKERSHQIGSSKSSRRRHQSDSLTSNTSKRRDTLSSRENSAEDVRHVASHQRLRRSTTGKDKIIVDGSR